MEKERKQQIIRAAIKRFAKHGQKKTTLDEVARDLRIGKATIYHYFSSKEELYFDCVVLETQLFIDELKLIFNNETVGISQRFLDYFSLKENTPEKYKLLYSFVLDEMQGSLFDNEKEMLRKFLADEINIIKLVLSSVYSNRQEPLPQNLPNFLAAHSWSLLFTSRFIVSDETINAAWQKEFLFKMLEKLIS